jgi:predicted permease
MRWLMRWLVSDADRRVIEGELAELHEWRLRQNGARAARRWLRRQQFGYALHLTGDRMRRTLEDVFASVKHLGGDLRYSVRSLVRAPVVATTIILTVGIGLGATTAMVSVTRAVLVNPLPYADANNLYWIYTDSPPFKWRFTVVDYRALEADHSAFSAIAAYQTNNVTVTRDGAPERATAKDVTGSYFPLMRQRAAIGRLFDPSDDARGDRIAVLTYRYWTRRFGADPGVVGRALTLDGESYTIVGVLENTDGPLEQPVSVFTAAHWAPPKRKGPFSTMALARLNPGVSRDAAVEEMRATTKQLFPIWRASYQDEKATWGLQDLKTRVVGNIGSTLFMVLAAVACVLLIASANAVNLLLARALERSRELAIRGALGASRARMVQALLAEAAVLTVAAAAVGLAVAAGAIELITTYGATYVPRLAEIHLAGPTLVWLSSLALASGMLIGLVPAIHGSRLKLDRSLASSGRSTSDAPTARRVRRALVAAEFSLATPLITAALLVTASLGRLSHVPVGIDTERLLTAQVSLVGPRYSQDATRAGFWKQLVERLGVLPGVNAAAIADSRPPSESYNQNDFDLEDHPAATSPTPEVSTWVGVSPGFFKAMGLALVRGRLLDDHSLQDDVIVVDGAWANRFFPGEDVIGRRMRSGGCTTCPWTTIVGVVENVKWAGLGAAPDGTVYYPFVDLPQAFLVLRTAGDPTGSAHALQEAVRELDSSVAVSDVATGDDLMDASLAQPRYLSVLVGMFALTALVLSIVAVYGVMAHFVQQHRRDIGIRMALGGEPRAVRRMVILSGVKPVIAGVAIGVSAALLSSSLIRALLFEVSPNDPATLAIVPAALVIAATAACWGPARRAASLDPARILRDS